MINFVVKEEIFKKNNSYFSSEKSPNSNEKSPLLDELSPDLPKVNLNSRDFCEELPLSKSQDNKNTEVYKKINKILLFLNSSSQNSQKFKGRVKNTFFNQLLFSLDCLHQKFL